MEEKKYLVLILANQQRKDAGVVYITLQRGENSLNQTPSIQISVWEHMNMEVDAGGAAPPIRHTIQWNHSCIVH